MLLLLSIALCSFRDYKKCETCANSDLKGKVKFLTERTITGDKDAVEGKYEFEQKVYHYDKKGQLKWQSDSSYVYDKITKRGISNVYVELYTYKKGKLQKIMSGPERSPVIQEFTYDKKGRKILVEQYTLVPETKSIRTDRSAATVYSDDGKESETSRKALGAGGLKPISKEKEEYDEMGRKIKSFRYDERDEKYVVTNDYRYDANNNIAVERQYNTFNGEIQFTTIYAYLEQGLLANEMKKTAGGISQKTTYTYSEPDKQANFLKVTIYTDSQPPITIRRHIEYY